MLTNFNRLAAYVESEPERKKAALEAKKEKLEKLERQLGITPGGSKDVVPHVGMKRRLDDTDFLEESQNIVESVKSSVAQGMSILSFISVKAHVLALRLAETEKGEDGSTTYPCYCVK